MEAFVAREKIYPIQIGALLARHTYLRLETVLCFTGRERVLAL